MPNLHSQRPARRIAGALLAAACLLAVPTAQAEFRVSATLGNFVFTTFDTNGEPLPGAPFLFDGSGNTSAYLIAGGATTTLPSANLFANYTSDTQLWPGTGSHLLPPAGQAQVSGGNAAAGFSASIANQGMQIEVFGNGADQAAQANARAGSIVQGSGLLTLGPLMALQVEVTLSYTLRQDGQCLGDVCDAAFVQASLTQFDGAPGSFTGGGPAASYGIGPRSVVNAGYAWFLTDSSATFVSGTQTLTGYFVNDTEQPKTVDLYLSLTGAGSSVAAVPEPGAAEMLVAGALAMLAVMRRRRRT